MVADTNTQAEAATKASGEAVAETAKVAAKAGERTANTARKSAAKAARKSATTARKTPKSRRKAKPARSNPRTMNKRNEQMEFDRTNAFAGFGAFPGATTFEKMLGENAGRTGDVAKRSRKAVEDLADMYRGNIDAFVEAGRIASSGAQSIARDIASKSRNKLEQTADTVRSFAEAKSPTELLQLQSDFARTAFDRFVEDSSNLTESFVKLAGEALQPISNRASANVERFNEIAA